jgi:hypothetical protein
MLLLLLLLLVVKWLGFGVVVVDVLLSGVKYLQYISTIHLPAATTLFQQQQQQLALPSRKTSQGVA